MPSAMRLEAEDIQDGLLIYLTQIPALVRVYLVFSQSLHLLLSVINLGWVSLYIALQYFTVLRHIQLIYQVLLCQKQLLCT